MKAAERIAGMLFGIAVGDAMGVPVEFCSRADRKADPVSSMRDQGPHRQETGTWSDDASLAFCTAEAMLSDYSAGLLASYFLKWRTEAWWSARGLVFDIGISTSQALQRLREGVHPSLSGGNDEQSNGNGSLMRIAALAWHPEQEPLAFYQLVKEASAITHRHERSVLACHYLLEFLRLLLSGNHPISAFEFLRTNWPEKIRLHQLADEAELLHFHRLLSPGFPLLPEDEIQSGGYVMHSLEAAVWCLLQTRSFREAVLLAVNLGHDTDTTAAICGALAGTHYGKTAIPEEWLAVLASADKIQDLTERFTGKFSKEAD